MIEVVELLADGRTASTGSEGIVAVIVRNVMGDG